MLDFSLFGRRRSRPLPSKTDVGSKKGVNWESLENRQLLSASMFGASAHHGFDGEGMWSPPSQGVGETIEFSQAPSAVQSGLDKLATTDSVTAPAATSTIRLGNVWGIEIYSYDAASTGTDSVLTVDVNGNPVTAATHTATTFGAITNAAVTNEINAIATALDLTAATSTTSVDVLTASDGSAVYSVALAPASTTDTDHLRNSLISVDGNGNPVGHEQVPLSVLSTAIQTGLTKNAPTSATALAGTSLIDVNTIEGATLYTAHYSSTGTQTTVTVDQSGALTSLPSIVQTTFGAIPTAAQTELQTLATADGFTGTIDSTLAVTESIEVNGTIIYTIHLPITSTSDSSTTQDTTITLSVDAQGNPTVPPGLGGIGRFGPPFGGDNGGGGGSGYSSSSGGMNCNSGGSRTSDSGGSSGSTGSSGSSPSLSVGAGDGSTTAASISTTTNPTLTASTTTPVLTKAEERVAANAAANAARIAKEEAAKAAREAAAAARKAARLAAEAAKKAAE
jgi:uncharacterized membrane protein YgcG